MTSKLGILSNSKSASVLASVLATAVGLAPIHAVAAPPEEEAEEISVGSPEDEGEEISVGGPEEEGEEISVGEPEEGVPVEGEEGVEGEEPVEEPVEEEPVEEEGEGEELAVEEPPPPEVDEGSLRPAEPTWGPKDQYKRNGKGMLITGGVVTGLGAAFIVTSVLITKCDYESNLSCKYGDQRDFLVPLAVTTTGLGLLLVGVGVGNMVKYKRWQNWTPEKTAVVPTYMAGGGGVAWVGAF